MNSDFSMAKTSSTIYHTYTNILHTYYFYKNNIQFIGSILINILYCIIYYYILNYFTKTTSKIILRMETKLLIIKHVSNDRMLIQDELNKEIYLGNC